jgi:PAS domain S-box-containing protein
MSGLYAWRPRGALQRYLCSLAAVLLGVLLRIPFWNVLSGEVPFITFFPGVIVAAWLGGFGPGMLATGLSAVTAMYFFMAPQQTWYLVHASDSVSLIIFLAVGSFITWISALLQRSLQRFRSTLESIRDGFATFDAGWKFTYLNGAAEVLLGKTAVNLIGKNHWDEYPDTRGTAIEASYRRARNEQIPVRLETYYPALNKWFDTSAFPTDDGGLSLYFHDITSRKEIEARARLTEERLSRLADANVIGIVVADLEGGVREANDEYLRILGYTRADLTAGRVSWTGCTAPECLSADYEHIAEAKKTGVCQPFEKIYVRPNGTRVPVLIGFALIGENRDEAIAFVLDLTAQKAAEQALRDSERRLKRKSDDVQQFTYSVTHDLSSPLRTITSFLQLLEHRHSAKLDENARTLIGHAIAGAKRMQQMVDALLEYAHAGESADHQPAKISMDAALAEAIEDLQATADAKQAIVTSNPLPWVEAEPVAVRQVFQNLLSNALKYSRPEMPPRVHISATSNGNVSVISVKDEGIGIPAAYQDKVFGLFQRLHGADIPGTGIGLATCKKLVEQWNGRIWVESNEGQGATFFFTVPVVHSAAASLVTSNDGHDTQPRKDPCA